MPQILPIDVTIEDEFLLSPLKIVVLGLKGSGVDTLIQSFLAIEPVKILFATTPNSFLSQKRTVLFNDQDYEIEVKFIKNPFEIHLNQTAQSADEISIKACKNICNIFLIAIDLSASFEQQQVWLQQMITQLTKAGIASNRLVVIGTKADKVASPSHADPVIITQLEALVKEQGLRLIATSATQKLGIDEAFSLLASEHIEEQLARSEAVAESKQKLNAALNAVAKYLQVQISRMQKSHCMLDSYKTRLKQAQFATHQATLVGLQQQLAQGHAMQGLWRSLDSLFVNILQTASVHRQNWFVKIFLFAWVQKPQSLKMFNQELTGVRLQVAEYCRQSTPQTPTSNYSSSLLKSV